MKLNLEIEIDWIDEESSIDDVVKQEIINGVMLKVGNSIKEKTEAEVDSKINDLIVDTVNEKTSKMFDDFTNKQIVITDSFGDQIKVFDNLKDLMKDRFDNFMTQSVDDSGRATSKSFGRSHQRINYIIDKQLKEFADKFTTDAVKKVSEEIKEHVKNGLTSKLGSELMKVLKINDMLKLKD